MHSLVNSLQESEENVKVLKQKKKVYKEKFYLECEKVRRLNEKIEKTQKDYNLLQFEFQERETKKKKKRQLQVSIM